MKTLFGLQYPFLPKLSRIGHCLPLCYDVEEDDVQILVITARSDEMALLDFFGMPNVLGDLWDKYRFSQPA